MLTDDPRRSLIKRKPTSTPIERPKVFERPSTTPTRSLRSIRASPDRRIRRPLRSGGLEEGSGGTASQAIA